MPLQASTVSGKPISDPVLGVAAPIVVDSLGDHAPDGGLDGCTLPEAIAQANAENTPISDNGCISEVLGHY